MILGLGFSACKKEDSVKSEPELVETIIIKGKQYDLNYIKRGLSIILNAPVDQIIYDSERHFFSLKGYVMEINPDNEIDDILKLKEAGYDF